MNREWTYAAKVFFSEKKANGENMSALARRLDISPSRMYQLANWGARLKRQSDYRKTHNMGE